MIRPILLYLTLVLSSVLTQAVYSNDQRPNILFIYTDDQSYRTVSSYPGSYNFAKTPNIDSLARQGIRFDAAYIGTWCMPSRAS
ncbi:MAG: sulfatase-like hydrolase/transferase, partial [Planctomycetota bacterium]|nr:sulfatase-like hydrolase/transferase [Planctomycetota bacterium]